MMWAMRTAVGFSLVVLAWSGAAQASCDARAPAAYEDIDRVVLVRCQVNTGTYPCFRASISLDNLTVTGGSVNAVMGTGLRGVYTLKSPSPYFSKELIGMLREFDFLTMTLAPLKSGVIDAPFNILAIRRCGSVTAIESIAPIDDAGHVAWNNLLDRLQAAVLTQTWIQTSHTFDSKDLSRWFNPQTKPSDFIVF